MVHGYFFLCPVKEKGTPGKKDSDSSTSAKVGAAAAGAREGARAGTTAQGDNGEKRGVEARGGGSRGVGFSSREGAWKSLGKASQVAGGPGRRPSQGHVARAGRCRRAPGVGQTAGEWPRARLRGAGLDPAHARHGPAL